MFGYRFSSVASM